MIIRLYEAATGREAILEATGETFAVLGVRRRLERSEREGDVFPLSRNR